jgi:hypothetical protein
MQRIKLEYIIIILSFIIFLSIYEDINSQNKQDLSDQIVEYSPPEITQASNGSSVYVTGTLRDNSPKHFKDVILSLNGIGSQGQTIDSKMFKIEHIDSNSNVDYNVTLENNSPIVAGDFKVLNATEII